MRLDDIDGRSCLLSSVELELHYAMLRTSKRNELKTTIVNKTRLETRHSVNNTKSSIVTFLNTLEIN